MLWALCFALLLPFFSGIPAGGKLPPKSCYLLTCISQSYLGKRAKTHVESLALKREAENPILLQIFSDPKMKSFGIGDGESGWLI